MEFLKKVLKLLGTFNIEYNKTKDGEQKLNINIRDTENVGGGLVVHVDRDKKIAINSSLGEMKRETEEPDG